jgi:hypothetical protein
MASNKRPKNSSAGAGQKRGSTGGGKRGTSTAARKNRGVIADDESFGDKHAGFQGESDDLELSGETSSDEMAVNRERPVEGDR